MKARITIKGQIPDGAIYGYIGTETNGVYTNFYWDFDGVAYEEGADPYNCAFDEVMDSVDLEALESAGCEIIGSIAVY